MRINPFLCKIHELFIHYVTVKIADNFHRFFMINKAADEYIIVIIKKLLKERERERELELLSHLLCKPNQSDSRTSNSLTSKRQLLGIHRTYFDKSSAQNKKLPSVSLSYYCQKTPENSLHIE